MGDKRLMRRAIELAGKSWTHPNPRVGALVVSASGETVGEGWHEGPGTPHAEVVALREAGDRARGSTVYVTLEPCSHQGLTPPCTDVLISAEVAAVKIATEDPDHRVSGTGIYLLKQAGLAVEVGLEAERAVSVDPGYHYHRSTGRSRVTMKYAMTLDGSVGALDGSSQWISSEEARRDAHELRSHMDAVVVGAGTLRADDPMLDVRLDGYQGQQPVPVVVTGAESLPKSLRLWGRSPLVLTTTEVEIPSGELMIVAGDRHYPYPEAVVEALGQRGLVDVLLEGGPELAHAWLRAGVVNRGVLYMAAKMGGGRGLSAIAGEFATIDDAREVTILDVQRVGPDLRVEFE